MNPLLPTYRVIEYTKVRRSTKDLVQDCCSSYYLPLHTLMRVPIGGVNGYFPLNGRVIIQAFCALIFIYPWSFVVADLL